MVDEQAVTDSSKSEPFQAFEKNLSNIKHVLRLMLDDVEKLWGPVGELETAIEKIPRDADAWKKPAQDIQERVQNLWELVPFLYDWMLVMMVSFAEAYLEEALTLLVAREPEWMQLEKKKILSCAAELALEARDLSCPSENQWEELVKTMQRRWVKNFLDENQKKWIQGLTKFGVRYHDKENLTEKMTTIWKRRHEIVHSPQAQSEVIISKRTFLDALNVIDRFVEATDTFLMAFLKGSTHPEGSPIQD